MLTVEWLTLLVGFCIPGHDGADGGESDAGHCCKRSSRPHHPTTNNTAFVKGTTTKHFQEKD